MRGSARKYYVRMAQFVLKIEKLSHIMGPRASQDLRSPSLIMAPDSGEESAQSDGSDSDSDSGTDRNHILGIEDEFLLVLMKLCLRLTNLDFRFRVSEATVSNIFITWLNFLYIRGLGALKVWPHRRVILDNMPSKFKEEHPNNITIIDCTELKIQ